MKKYLLPQSGSFYKANLHCHSVFSDGKWTPEQIKENYKERGYSIIAFTDHNLLLSHQELSDEDFLALNGVEININDENYPDKHAKTCHLCMIALDPDNLIQPCWHRSEYLNKHTSQFRELVKFDETKPDVERIYNSDCINSIIKMFNRELIKREIKTFRIIFFFKTDKDIFNRLIFKICNFA